MNILQVVLTDYKVYKHITEYTKQLRRMGQNEAHFVGNSFRHIMANAISYD